jgi:hypothetical protein
LHKLKCFHNYATPCIDKKYKEDKNKSQNEKISQYIGLFKKKGAKTKKRLFQQVNKYITTINHLGSNLLHIQ